MGQSGPFLRTRYSLWAFFCVVLTLLLCHTHGHGEIRVQVEVLCRKVRVSNHVSPGDAFKCTVRLLPPYMNSQLSVRTGSEQFIRIDEWYGLSPVTERAVLWHDKGLVLFFAQQWEHMLHQLTKSAVTVERERETRSERQNSGPETFSASLQSSKTK